MTGVQTCALPILQEREKEKQKEVDWLAYLKEKEIHTAAGNVHQFIKYLGIYKCEFSSSFLHQFSPLIIAQVCLFIH